MLTKMIIGVVFMIIGFALFVANVVLDTKGKTRIANMCSGGCYLFCGLSLGLIFGSI